MVTTRPAGRVHAGAARGSWGGKGSGDVWRGGDIRRRCGSRTVAAERGSATVETAIGISAVVIVLGLCLAGLNAVTNALRCQDAAYAAARLAARGDDDAAYQAAEKLAPTGAQISIEHGETLVVARVRAPGVAMLPGLEVSAESAAAMEPGPGIIASGTPP